MDILLVFLIFLICMGISLFTGVTMLLPLLIGFVLFAVLCIRRGFSVKDVLRYSASSLKESFIVIGIMLLIGCLAGMWRLSGTVAYFVTLGISVIPPQMFLLAAFLLASAMSYALGTSFGVTATAGVILISIARAGGVNAVLAAGAILSGVYVGDRGSPAASSANLVAVLTGTDMRSNVKEMLKTSIVPFLLCCLLYGLLSFRAPMQTVDTEVMELLHAEFRLQWYCLIPAVFMIVLPFCGLDIKWSMLVSLAAAGAVALLVQRCSAADCLRAILAGYTAKNDALSDMLSGGGIVSMLEVSGILLVSCSYGGIFQGTGLLADVNRSIERLSGRIGRVAAMMVLSAAILAVFCNQTVGAIMQSNLSADLYGDSAEERNTKMLDMENSVILLAGLIPWCIACSVPRAMLDVGFQVIPLEFYLWLVPLWWLLRTSSRRQKPRAASVK